MFLYERYECPDYLSDNIFIYQGYRKDLSVYQCITSIFKWHNELFNIWSHLIGGLLFIILMCYIIPQLSNNHQIILSIFFIGVISQMFLSSLFHTFLSHSSFTMYNVMVRLDYIGVILNITGSNVPIIYFNFISEPMFQKFYLFSIVIIGVISIGICMIPSFMNIRYRGHRAIFFTLLGILGVIPLIHMSFLSLPYYMNLVYIEIVMGCLYLTGVFIYITLIPERFIPDVFDFTGNSHNIWHVLIILANITQLLACLFSMEKNK